MKAVLMSIQPKWCELIASGEKTVEVRKTKPKLEVPFKVYIYETKDKRFENIGYCWEKGKAFVHATGKVIGEFVCHEIEDYSKFEYDYYALLRHIALFAGTKDYFFLDKYLGGAKGCYAWHITDLVIYDKPRGLREFKRWVDRSRGQKYHEDMLYLQRPPQSWCYVEVTE